MPRRGARRAKRKRGKQMIKSTPVPIDGRDVILRDKYRAIIAQYSSEIVETLQAVKYDTEDDTARLVKCVSDLDNAHQQLLNIEVKLSYEESKSKETCGETDIDFDAMRQSIGRRLDQARAFGWGILGFG
jgi:uncharacterized lipoprotein YehR (DUF1307 family)